MNHKEYQEYVEEQIEKQRELLEYEQKIKEDEKFNHKRSKTGSKPKGFKNAIRHLFEIKSEQ